MNQNTKWTSGENMKELILFIKNLTARDVIALYAAIVSTIALVWNIVNSIIEKIPRLKVRIGVNNRLSIPDLEPLNSVISITAVNKSVYDMYINQPTIKLPERVNNEDKYKVSNPYNSIKYPILIKPREQYTIEYELGINLINLLKECSNLNKKVRIEITDTTGKRFKSNRVKISKIMIFAGIVKTKNS